MAIVIQQEKNGLNWVFLFGLLFILVMIGITAFYLFFVAPEKVDEKLISGQFKTISELQQLNLNPDDLIKDQRFTGLAPAIKLNIPDSTLIGKSNPFSKGN